MRIGASHPRSPSSRWGSLAGLPLADVAALAVALLWWAVALWWIAGAPLLAPDSLHYGLVARNLLEGRGYGIEVIPFHPGSFDLGVRIPEMHGLLQPLVLWPIFALTGPAAGALPAVGLAAAALTGWIAFVFARELFGSAAGWLAMLLTLGNGVVFFFGWAGTDDVGFAFLFMVSLYAFHRGWESGDERWLAGAGLAAGLATLEKLSGAVLPATFLAAAWVLGRRGERLGPRAALWLLAPFGLAVGAYLLRNVAAYGGLGFRFSPLAWLLKAEGYPAFHALYDEAPSLADAIRAIGWGRLPGLAAEQAGKLAHAVFSIPSAPGRRLNQDLQVLALGIPALLLHLRRQRCFAIIGGLAALASVAFFCVVHHVEARYFAMLVPLAAVSLAGAVVSGLRAPRTGPRVAAGAALVLALLAVGWRLPVLLDRGWIAGRAAAGACPRVFDRLADESRPDAVVLSLDPWRVAWETRRFSVMVPSGPDEDVARVAKRYGAGWLVLGPSAARSQERRGLADRAPAALGAEVVLRAGPCTLYRLESR